jgi:hypothetical protein
MMMPIESKEKNDGGRGKLVSRAKAAAHSYGQQSVCVHQQKELIEEEWIEWLPVLLRKFRSQVTVRCEA